MKPNTKLVDRHGVQVCLMPMEYWRPTQDINGSTSHKGSFNIDLGGRYSGGGKAEDVLAPYDGKIVYKSTYYNAIIFQTLKPVKQPFGVSHVYMALSHDDDISNLKVGQVFKQGEVIYQEGGIASDGKTKKYARHVHLGVARGVYKSGNPFYRNSYGTYLCLKGAVDPRTVFFKNDTIMLSDGIAPWAEFKEDEIIDTVHGVGDPVFIKPTATKWATGQTIKPYVKRNGKYPGPYKIVADGDNPPKGKRYPRNAWLLAKVNSWIKKTDVE